jgi:hypothetical protein
VDSFDLGRLTDFDFEAVCKDVAEELLEFPLEIFAPGADQGVDLRYLRPESRESVVVQCKHWRGSGAAALVRHMAVVELPKIRKLKPSRYVLMTSVGLTKGTKDRLSELLSPYVCHPGDILGAQEIENALRHKPAIVRRHMRLWLSSTAVLEGLLSKNVLVRSEFLKNEIRESIKIYVENDSFTRAEELLASKHVAIIAGIPGIGKTTLAHILAAQHLAAGYELVEISENIDEAYRLWDDSVPQFFYYDDFLGQTSLGAKLPHKNEDQRIISFLERVHKAGNKRFVLTTREYILEQAKISYERLARADFKPLTCVVDLSDYVLSSRAKILYNHVYNSTVSIEAKRSFGHPQVYNPIINHSNFSPRLISLSLRAIATGNESHPDIPRRLLSNLDRPRNLWEHIVHHQLDSSDVEVVEVLYSLPGRVRLASLTEAWKSYRSNDDDSSENRLKQALRTLEGSMVKVETSPTDSWVSYHNPSVRDYMLDYFLDQPGRLVRLVNKATFFEQVVMIRESTFDRLGRDKSMLRKPVEDAVSSSFGDLRSGMWYAVVRIFYLVQISEKMQSPGLREFAAAKLQIFLRDYEDSFVGPELNWLFELIRLLDDSDVDELSRHAPDLMEIAAELIGRRLESWSSARRAEELLFRFPKGVPDELRIEVSEAIYSHADNFLTSWLEDGLVDLSALSTAREIFDYLAAFCPDELDDDLRRLEIFLDDTAQAATPAAVPRLAGTVRNDSAYEGPYIRKLMSSLLSVIDTDEPSEASG